MRFIDSAYSVQSHIAAGWSLLVSFIQNQKIRKELSSGTYHAVKASVNKQILSKH